MQSFARVTSGLAAAQAGLYTVGHNISNSATDGYTRQRVNFADNPYNTIGYNGTGNMKLGLGAKIVSITQLRDEFLDKTYRKASSKASFHNVKGTAIEEIENILGELHGDARLSKSIDGLWASLQELVTHPDGMETRSMFIQQSISFVTKTNQISEDLFKYQLTLNEEVIKSVNRINEITTQIEDLNKKIMLNESAGDNANDYRDVRNNLIDELSLYGELDVKESPSGSVTILMEGKDLVANGTAKLLGLRYSSEGYPFVEPVFNPKYVKDGEILKADEPAQRLFSNLSGAKIGGNLENDNGSLKALLLIRGNAPANYTSSASEVQNYTIPKFQRELDILVNKIVTLLNDAFAPKDHNSATSPADLEGNQFIELFSRKFYARYDANGNFIDEGAENPATLYSMGNIEVNPLIMNNFNRLCLSLTGDIGDTSLIENILSNWKGDTGNYLPSFSAHGTPQSFDGYYSKLVTNLGEEGSTSKLYVESQNKIVTDTISARQQLSGVSLDEELTDMMKFQHAYDAAAKIINVIDTMMESVIGLKR